MPVVLSDRLRLIEDQIGEGDSVLDIGTDHGYLPVHLAETGKSGKIIMSDVSEGSLDKAKNDAAAYLGENYGISARLGDGLDVVSPGEVDTVVIAGMGGLLIRDILDWDLSKTRTFRKFILQPRNNSGPLRKWIYSVHGDISKDLLVLEGKHYPEIIVASFGEGGKGKAQVPEDVECEYPDDLESPYDKDLVSCYLRHELTKEREIIQKITENAENKEAKLSRHEEKLRRLESLCEKMYL